MQPRRLWLWLSVSRLSFQISIAILQYTWLGISATRITWFTQNKHKFELIPLCHVKQAGLTQWFHDYSSAIFRRTLWPGSPHFISYHPNSMLKRSGIEHSVETVEMTFASHSSCYFYLREKPMHCQCSLWSFGFGSLYIARTSSSFRRPRRRSAFRHT